MKKTLATLLFLSIATISFAQNASQVRLGLTAHPTFGFLKIENGKGSGLSTGFSYGLMSDFEFAENYSFATGLTITTINGKGAVLNYLPYYAASGSTNSAEYDVKFKMQYIEIPLSIKLKTDETNDMKWYGQFGLTTNFRIGAKQDVKSGNNTLASDIKATDQTKFLRAGMIIGGGLEYRLSGKTSLLTGLTYNNGLTNIAKNGQSIKNHYVGLNIGVFF
ncbi:porin family protein [Pedobacter xixiisoli]|uniref:Outer membrane protein beta-barrel domain-containing protein n=1 Tax=Pedobacter xixiisoli TaxID=1476464 RepID=A0A286AEV0_9SPHI|nr:porin family protein [Pedobacter xixiisoli]SOD20411.1 Outer membrane protein beta-barrel domain-containing protein [Pedobacter xixiisoli]